MVLDGWGHREDPTHNAVAGAKTPHFDALWKKWPHALLQAGGLAVGLPEGQVGNSEVGHTTIGAGAPLDTDLVRIAKAIENGDFAKNPALTELFDHVRLKESVLHVMGLLSPGGVHSHSEHLYAFLRLAKQRGITKIAIHAITDGRDTPPQSGAGYLKELEEVLEEVGIGTIATVTGRFFAMDRDKNWHRLAEAERAYFTHQAPHHAHIASDVIRSLYQTGQLDEHLEPVIFADAEGKTFPIAKHDGVFFFNFRPDRARMLASKLAERQHRDDLLVVTMTEYDPVHGLRALFPKKSVETTLAAEVARHGLSQVHIAETEKFPHATYFLNGGREQPHEGERHVMLESRKDVSTHDKAPEMQAEGIADAAVLALQQGSDFVFINFANPDMVGHTGNVPAIITAVETVDTQMQRVVAEAARVGATVLVTADHGNAEVNVDVRSGITHTAHTLNPVPFIAVGAEGQAHDGTLADLAPTVLSLLGLSQPSPMTGTSLLTVR